MLVNRYTHTHNRIRDDTLTHTDGSLFLSQLPNGEALYPESRTQKLYKNKFDSEQVVYLSDCIIRVTEHYYTNCFNRK